MLRVLWRTFPNENPSCEFNSIEISFFLILQRLTRNRHKSTYHVVPLLKVTTVYKCIQSIAFIKKFMVC